jgi:hypothetical protein
MRRTAAILLVPLVPLAACGALVACAALAGCSLAGRASPDNANAAGRASPDNANAAVKVTGPFDKMPRVTIPHEDPSGNLVSSIPIKGTGARLISGDYTLVNVISYEWSGTKSTLQESNYEGGYAAYLIPPHSGLFDLVTARQNPTLGSRIVAVVPPRYERGSGGGTLVLVVDLLQQFSPDASASGTRVSQGGGKLPTVSFPPIGQAPTVKIPDNSPPTRLSVTTLIKGNGPKLAPGDTVVAQLVAVDWRTGDVVEQSWGSSAQPGAEPLSFLLGGQLVAGWKDGLPGVTVGSRVMLVVPPALDAGPSAGIKKNDTIVYVFDIVGVQAPSG